MNSVMEHPQQSGRKAKISKSMKTQSSEAHTKVESLGTITQRLPAWLNRDWFWALILVLAIFLTYQPVWYAEYIWDDDVVVTANPCIVGPLGLKEIWTTRAADICPFVLTTFWVEHALWGLAPLPYHLLNVFLHGTSAFVLWMVLRSLRIPGAWLGATFWAVHPVQVESVAWITEMKNTESGLFFLLSILFLVRFVKATNLDRTMGSCWNISSALLFAALAMASKSSTVILPIVLCLCVWWIGGGWNLRRAAAIGAIFIMSLVAGVASMWTQGLNLAADPIAPRSWPERMAEAGESVWFYLGKLLWPYPLITTYPRWEVDAGQWFSYLPLLAVLAILLILWQNRERWSRSYLFAFAYFLVALLPVLGFADNTIFRYSLVYDHFQYLASIGPLALAGAAMAQFKTFLITKRVWLQSSFCAGLLLVLMILSWQRCWAYESSETLWSDTVAKNPYSWIGQNNLGHFLEARGLLKEAIEHYQMSLKINPNYATAHDNLGEILLRQGKLDEAIEQFHEALKIAPTLVGAHSNLGLALFQKGQVDDALAEYRKELEIAPYLAEAHNNFGQLLLQTGHLDEAVAQFQRSLEISPNIAEFHNNLGVALFQKRQTDQAIVQFQDALQLDPDTKDAQNNLAKVESMLSKSSPSK